MFSDGFLNWPKSNRLVVFATIGKRPQTLGRRDMNAIRAKLDKLIDPALRTTRHAMERWTSLFGPSRTG